MAPDEKVLLEALRRGDEAVYAALVDRYYSAMRRFAMGYVRDADAAEDVIQETWVAVMNGIHRFEGRATLRTWIFRILQNVARTKATQQRRYVRLSSGDATPFPNGGAPEVAGGEPRDPERCAESSLLAREIVALIESAIQGLPEKRRAVIILRDIEGWTADETSELLGISRANQRVLLHRARLAVREAIRPYVTMKASDAIP